MYSRRIILSVTAMKQVLRLLYSSHAGLTKTMTLTKGLYFWPGILNDIKQAIVSGCNERSQLLPSQVSNPSVTSPPSHHLGYPNATY